MAAVLLDRLIQFAESGNQQKIQLKDQCYQGWVMEITDTALLISTGFADKSGKDQWLEFTDLEHATLSYWDNQQDQWINFALS
ncbi:hypothetical protein [Acinetobacter larvae]|uniref:Uncharacterized protein n=1 Tax=Acinetobacter larvae TaxID=1789224 RepID=A0A1B2LW04_9GAMM|nr:hypothetical protein [Acinetobacter larvae]AOA56943.1 hypothetical protein BFG52_00255 [Acinetobacter larvae]